MEDSVLFKNVIKPSEEHSHLMEEKMTHACGWNAHAI